MSAIAYKDNHPLPMSQNLLEENWVQNQGAACTAAAVLAGLGALGAIGLPGLGPGSATLAGTAFAAPALLDYVSWSGRRAPLDLRIERLAAQHGLGVVSHTGPVMPLWPLRPIPGEVLICHLAWGQEAPGRFGTWGWNPLRPSTYSTGGHSVLLVAVDGRRWTVLDPNHPGLQNWPRPGIATAATRIRRA
jgi:hypothetical protein